jgi:predicted ribosome quality control (RQC) complex YloA/Tae2 family protein
VAGYPGSHVVIRSHDDDLPVTRPETLRDAAVLAAFNSKAAGGGRVQVSFCRCRDVSKPSGAKAGMVRLSGDVATITLDLKTERKRFERLDAQKNQPQV